MFIDFGSTQPTDPITIVSFSKKDDRAVAAELLKSRGFQVCYFDKKDLAGKNVYYMMLELPDEHSCLLIDLAHKWMRYELKLNTSSTTWPRQAWDEHINEFPVEIKSW